MSVGQKRQFMDIDQDDDDDLGDALARRMNQVQVRPQKRHHRHSKESTEAKIGALTLVEDEVHAYAEAHGIAYDMFRGGMWLDIGNELANDEYRIRGNFHCNCEPGYVLIGRIWVALDEDDLQQGLYRVFSSAMNPAQKAAVQPIPLREVVPRLIELYNAQKRPTRPPDTGARYYDYFYYGH